jgi:hypothetical protein
LGLVGLVGLECNVYYTKYILLEVFLGKEVAIGQLIILNQRKESDCHLQPQQTVPLSTIKKVVPEHPLKQENPKD